jgi:hypothetical protein
VEDGIEFVRSMENDSDIFTKNVTQDITMTERFGIGRVLEFGVIPYVQLSL